MQNDKRIVISLGGSLIIPNEIDISFLKQFIFLIKEYIEKGYSFVIITGGGRISRNYTVAAQEIVSPTKDDLDWIGISTTRVNAEFMRVLFGEYAYDQIVFNPTEIPQTEKPVILGGGWKPGNSSDFATVLCAISIGANKIINLSNVDYVYDKDPKFNLDAVKIEKISWSSFRKLLPNEWDPGLNSPFDPIAAIEAEKFNLSVSIMNGRQILNLRNYLDGKDFVGTIIK